MTTLIAVRAKLGGKRGRHSTRRRAEPRLGALARLIAGVAAHQRDRWILWAPVAVIAGAACYFALPEEPPFVVLVLGFVLFGFLAFAVAAWPTGRPGGFARAAMAGVFAMVCAGWLGAAAGGVRTVIHARPPLAQPLEGGAVEGWVISRQGGARPRMVILVRALEGVRAPPRLVRVSTFPGAEISPGRALRCRASLTAPEGPLAPRGYDFARRAAFMQLGAVGFTWGRCVPLPEMAPASRLDQALVRMSAVRADVTDFVREAAPGRGGAVAAALIAGDDSGLMEADQAFLRDSGLGHLLSVSGLHMSLVGGATFGVLLHVLALIGPLALRVSVKKLAACGALSALLVYFILSGASVPALRAFVMAAVAFGAILLDRPALTMRGLALAALIIVLWMPESVLEPGFQMSFAATAALVAAFEAHQDHARRQDGPPPAPGPLIAGLSQIVGWLTAALATSFIAGLATEPFALHHFQRLSFYGLVANLAVTPIVAFVVTPSAVLAALGAVFGAAEAPLEAMAASLDLVLGVAEVFGGRPEAVSGAPATPEAFLPLAAMGIAWATLWRGWLRLAAAAWLAAALALWALTPPAVIALDAEAQAVFARVQRHGTGGTEWALARGQARSAFARERLGGLLGLTARQVAMLTEPEGCAASLCRWRTPAGRPAFLVRSPDGFLAACRRGAIVASRHDAPVGYRARCGTLALFDGTRLRREGGVIVREGGPAGAAALTFTFARPAAIRRAWTAAPPPAPRGTDQ